MIPLLIYAESAWDQYTITNPQWKQWMRWRPDIVSGWFPYQNPNIGDYKKVLAYVDSYAIYNNNPPQPTDIAVTHPDWILHDDQGNKLYIPWGCANGTCPQYAGDFTNPAFVQNQLQGIQGIVDAKYQGIFLDDVNLSVDVSDGTGRIVIPAGMTADSWAWKFVDFLQQIRSNFPNIIIIHNSVWFDAAPQDAIKAQIRACNYYNMERGYGDPNLTYYTIAQQLQFVQMIHDQGRNVVQMEYSQNPIVPDTKTLQDKINLFKLGYKSGDLMVVKDLFPGQPNWSVMDSNTV